MRTKYSEPTISVSASNSNHLEHRKSLRLLAAAAGIGMSALGLMGCAANSDHRTAAPSAPGTLAAESALSASSSKSSNSAAETSPIPEVSTAANALKSDTAKLAKKVEALFKSQPAATPEPAGEGSGHLDRVVAYPGSYANVLQVQTVGEGDPAGANLRSILLSSTVRNPQTGQTDVTPEFTFHVSLSDGNVASLDLADQRTATNEHLTVQGDKVYGQGGQELNSGQIHELYGAAESRFGLG